MNELTHAVVVMLAIHLQLTTADTPITNAELKALLVTLHSRVALSEAYQKTPTGVAALEHYAQLEQLQDAAGKTIPRDVIDPEPRAL